MSSAVSAYKSKIVAVVTLVIFIVAAAVLRHELARLSLQDVLDGLQAVQPLHVLAAMIFTAASYFMLTFYDFFALRAVRHPLPWKQSALTSFIGFGISHSVGVPSLSGGSIRYRAYSALGVSTLEIAGVVGMLTLTFTLGVGTLIGFSMLLASAQAAYVLHIQAWEARALGLVSLAAISAYLLLTLLKQKAFNVRGREVRLPAFTVTLGQLATASIDLCFAAATLYTLLPDSIPLHYFGFLGLFVIVILAGMASNVPGGLGVVEGLLLFLIPGATVENMAAPVLLYRVIYYVIPFILGVSLLSIREVIARRRHFVDVSYVIRGWIESFGPQVVAALVFIAGAVLLFSGATPEVDTRMDWLRDFVPAPVLELSHLIGSAIGVGLLVLARGLYRRLDGAWWTAMVLMGAGAVASLLRGLQWEQALLLLAEMGVLAMTHDRFYRRASLLDLRKSGAWAIATALTVGAAVLVGIASHRDIQYANELWWQFAFDDDAPRVMRASVITILLAAGYALLQLMSPVREQPKLPQPGELDEAAKIATDSHDTLAYLALLNDKQLLFSEARDAFIMYQRSGRSIVALGDPAGNPARFEELIWKFREICDREAGWPVFYQVTEKYVSLYLDLGLSLSKLGEEARVNLAEFSMEGSKRQSLRNEHRRGPKEGASFKMLTPEEVEQEMPRLKEISDQWLVSKAAAEKGFSVGRFDPDYLRHATCAAVMREGKVVAFANLWLSRAHDEFSVDLMRFSAEAPRGVMDYLFIELILWGKKEGFEWFNLGMAPLSGLEKHPLAPFWHKLGLLVHRYGEQFYNFEGLRRYKEKFAPQWRARYLASPGGLVLPRVLLDTAALIAGGVREVVWK